MDRRGFLSALGALSGGLLVTWQAQAATFAKLGLNPIDVSGLRTDADRVFDLSISSADPSVTGVILWTHIRASEVRASESLYLQVASDAQFSQLVLQAEVRPDQIGAERDFTVKVDLDGQLPASPAGGSFYYRFIYAGTVSRTGRCRTLPSTPNGVRRLKFGLATCQDFTNGYYGAWSHLSRDESLDFVLHLGDFIYETAGDPRFQSLPYADRTMVLPSGGTVALDLADYRFIYRTIRSDRKLQAAMERHTFICVPDDHETANDVYWDYARDTLGAPDHPYTKDPKYGNSPALLKQLKLDSQRAWTEYVPARVSFNSNATHPFDALTVYRRFDFAGFLDLLMIENRTYRSNHPCGEGDYLQRYAPLGCSKGDAGGRTLLGQTQHNWLVDGLTTSRATWKLMGNQTYFGRLSLTPIASPLTPFNVDAWDGYGAERTAICAALRQAAVKNFLVVTGDLHTHIASDIKLDYTSPNLIDTSNYLGAEFMTPSITSSTLGEMVAANADPKLREVLVQGLVAPAVQVANPHIRFFNSSSSGYSTLELTDSYAEWVSYSVDKSVDSATASRKCVARQRKYMSFPWLMPQSTWGY